MKLNTTILAVLTASIGAVSAATISLNLRQANANQVIATTTTAGLDVQSNWNNTDGSNASTQGALIDSAGAVTTATVTWTSSNTWGDAEANTDADAGVGDAQLMRGYLDDGASGVDFTVSAIPYANYTAILYFATDTDGGAYRPVDVNGGSYSTTGTKNRYGTQPNWDATNSVTITGLSGDLVVDSLPRDEEGNRASIAGFQIVETVPEPSSAALLGLGGLALILRRRK